MADRFTLVADLPDASRANGEALRLVGDFLRAKSAKDVDATMRFFSRDTLTYADGTLGVVFEDVALATTRRGVVATIEHLTAAAPPPFGRGAELRRVALGLAAVMLGAVVYVHAAAGFYAPQGAEYPLALLATTLALAIAGPGRYSLDAVLASRRTALRASGRLAAAQ